MHIGTIGTGFIVDRALTHIQHVKDAHIEAIYSRSEEKAKEFAYKFNVGKTYTNMDAMFADEDIDTIYVASPNSLHYPYALKALKAHKNVICEKPFVSTVRELDELIEEAKKQHVFLWEAITNIYTPNLNIVGEHLKDVGDIKLVVCNFSQYSSRYQAYKDGQNPNVFNPAFSGGAIMDINVYNIHFCMYLFGKPRSYVYLPNIAENGIDTSGVLLMHYDGFMCVCIGCKDSSSEYFATIQGDKGTIKVDGGSTGQCINVSLTTINSQTDQPVQNIGVKQVPHMAYEFQAFESMIQKQDYKTCYELLDYSRDVLTIIETARKQAGVYFDAD